MLPAIETAANQRPPIVNSTAALAQIDARALRGRFENKDGFSRAAGCGSHAVRADIITLIGMKKKSLPAPAAFDAAITRYLGCLSGSQLSF